MGPRQETTVCRRENHSRNFRRADFEPRLRAGLAASNRVWDFSRFPNHGVGCEPTCGIEPRLNQPRAEPFRRTAGTAAGLVQIQKLKCGRKLTPPPALLLYLRCIQRGTSAPSLFPNAVAKKQSTCSFSTRPNCRSTDMPMSRPDNSLTGRNSLMISSTRA
jgi:hypothetical protein